MTAAWPKGLPRTLDYPKAGISALLAGCAHSYGDRPALVDGDETVGFAELYDHSLRIAQGLRERGVRPGDAVALHLPNSLWYTVSYYGILLAGAAVVPTNPTQPPLALARQLADSRAVAAVTHPAVADRLAEAATEQLRLTVVVPPTAAAPSDRAAATGVPLADLLAAEPAPATEVGPDAVAHLAFTGGTTGVPKAVRVLHRNLLAATLQLACWRSATRPELDDQGRILLNPVEGAATDYHARPGEASQLGVAPLYHAMGCVGQSIFAANGVTVVMFGRFDPVRYLDAIERHRVHTVTGSPSLFHALLAVPGARERDLSSARLVSSGAAPIDPTTMQALQQLFPDALVTEAYGLTEATVGLTIRPLDRTDPGPVGSVGLPLFDTDLEIRALDGSGPVPAGEEGELWARGPQIADGYLDHPELTAEQFQDGWLRTGDLGRIDEQGYLFLVGRAKDMLIYKGYNVYPGPLEDLLTEHPAVAQAAVVGAPGGDAGEIPVAYVVPHAGAAAPDLALAEQLMAYVAERVAPYQRIRAVEFLDALPVSPTGKILKTELRRRAAS